jgi:hypothetical protein
VYVSVVVVVVVVVIMVVVAVSVVSVKAVDSSVGLLDTLSRPCAVALADQRRLIERYGLTLVDAVRQGSQVNEGGGRERKAQRERRVEEWRGGGV